MKNWKNKLVPMLFALASVGFLVQPVKQLIKGEPLNFTFLVLASNCFVFAIVFLAVGARRKPRGGSGPHTPRPSHPVAGQEPAEK